ncbi:DUF4839 domain-containing protein [Rhodococcus cercidiphylli]|uniref:DUF4839 domain-containing protein n=1 Tax=Rhodococcus cercidiphylli TaxID=489916 RepID=A0ABU4AWE2_9NOCA|nr:DUF4839 domain-containing protein [Rhodococcus cercidiphylli]MDV6230548.1 DUF4839 domain-containing protein [Rhodococcus cercidiphylli]
MATDTDIAYETKTVRAVRGMVSRTIEKWEGEGWEVVSQSPGKIKTEIAFRRPAPRSHRLLWIVGGGALTLVLATVIAIGAIGENSTAPVESASPASSKAAAPSEQPSPDAVGTGPASSPEPEGAVLTSENSAELAAVLALIDTCSPDIAAFASAHRGRTVSFPGSIGAMAPYEDASTRYLILIGAGDFSETSAPGPAFQLRDVNLTADLHWSGSVPETIGVGTNLSVTAKIDRYEDTTCLFLLDPVATAVR